MDGSTSLGGLQQKSFSSGKMFEECLNEPRRLSEGLRQMKLEEACLIATNVLAQLFPHCTRIEIAGSIRRKKPEVKDIEILCIVAPQRMKDFVHIVNKWEKVKGEPTGKYTQRLLPEGIKLDLFIAKPDNWGLLLAIRTGSVNFSHHVLARSWVKKGYKSVDGMLTRNGKQITVGEETDLFELLEIPYIEPENR